MLVDTGHPAQAQAARFARALRFLESLLTRCPADRDLK